MGAITTQVYKSLESYWRHRNYKRIEESPEKKKREVRLGDGRRSHRPRVKVARLTFRLQVRVLSPVRLLTKLRDVYVSSMLAFAGEKKRLPRSVTKKESSGGELGQAIPKALKKGSVRGDFERKMMIHIYNSLVAPRELDKSCVSVVRAVN
ncbi:uncharacterized protein LOC120280975 [Dioscorea cayenensis subsp. rotundata]|uniref:Uncharacterized protein LOC120280975 n=1 Tax=Dioscorea cayennensis subsp. rotundata TaxID=55577 RepID=A0AB40CV45_DIOCR|nr:uncharacterized protein LOC120280975 [Dioscorea cayenensis subsp. rotundata]